MEPLKKKLNKRMDYLPVVFLQKERISKFIREMNHNNANDIKKLGRLMSDFEGDLKFYVKKRQLNTADLDKLKAELKQMDMFKDDGYVDKLIEIGGELVNIAGLVGLLPDYKEGELIQVAGG